MTRIAIEATGCDEGFVTVLEGSKKALEKNKNLELILVAGKDKLDKLPEEYDIPKEISLELTENTYNPENESIQKDTSIQRAVEMHKSGDAEAVIAPGDTKSAFVYSMKLLRKIPGVERSAIAVCFIFDNVLIDAGANVDCRPEFFPQFAVMGYALSKNYLKVEEPLIGLLANGKEKSKGNELIKASRHLVEKLRDKGYKISESYFEPNLIKDRSGGKIFVTDGFNGNSVLKTGEVFSELGPELLKEEIDKEPWYKRALTYSLLRKPYERLKQKIDYRSYAVAPLLGLNGNVMISHGRSDAEAIKNAILATEKYLRCNINEKLEEEIARCGNLNLRRVI